MFERNSYGNAWLLSSLYSFMSAKALPREVIERTLLVQPEVLLGIYFNDPEDMIIFTTRGVRWLHEDLEIFVPFKKIKKLENLADDKKLLVAMDDDVELKIPINNDTEEEPDIDTVFDFLLTSLNWTVTTDVSDNEIIDINNRFDLIEHLRRRQEAEKYATLIRALENDFPMEWHLQDCGISEAMLDQPETWRFLALALTVRPKNVQ